MTRWVRRLLVLTATVYLLQVTVFTSDWVIWTFGFTAGAVLSRPWTVLTYALLHGSFLHLLFNMLALFMFGPPVERRLGGAAFLRLYAVGAAGGALASLFLAALAPGAVVIGASAAVFGVMLAFVLEWPDAPVFVFPLPFPVPAKWLVVFLAATSLMLGVLGVRDGVAHLAHLGGFGAALLYLRAGALWGRHRSDAPRKSRPPVPVRSSGEGGGGAASPMPPEVPPPTDDAELAEVDRLLDKISERGLASLTPEERRLLETMSRHLRQGS